jgi:hypothetical protein
MGFLQIGSLVVYYVKLVLLGSTPRSIYNIKYGARTVQWGTLFPGITLLVVIGKFYWLVRYRTESDGIAALGYSLISPVMNGLACATFFAFYMLYKYLFLWVYEEDPTNDTGGLFYPKALQHIFVGLYVNQVSDMGLGYEHGLMIYLYRSACLLCSCWHAIRSKKNKLHFLRPFAWPS